MLKLDWLKSDHMTSNKAHTASSIPVKKAFYFILHYVLHLVNNFEL